MSTRQQIQTDFSRLLGLWLLFLGFNSSSMAAECQTAVARMVSLQGQVEVLNTDSQTWRQVQNDSTFCPGDQLRVSANSRAGLRLNNDTFLRLSEQSSIRFASPAREEASWLDLLQGIAHFISRITRPAQVNTPYVNASIEGTEFTVQVTEERGIISVMEGKVRAHNEQGESTLSSGQMAEAAKGQPPVVSTVVTPLDAVQWALYYPPIIDFNAQDEPANQNLRHSLDAYRQGDLNKAFAVLGDPAADSATLAYRASLNLAVGRVKAARNDIRQLLEQDPQNADALALQSIVATIQNQRQDALSSAEQAIQANPQSASAHLALSYARQAQFELKQALDATKQATKLDQHNALAWSRLSQLHLMFRQMDEATEAAQKAVAIDPGLAQTQTTLGFAYLVQLNLSDARQAFKQAAELDQASPMPRLGLGLVLIRDGELAAGRELLETAANLDPGNALIRSYLGKAYYEEKRNHEAATQFQLAKQRDPLDPTAWFYDAILKQSDNRPIEALEDLQHAIALNDNRAVYRSRLLLDEDQAARNASLARIYADLGFQQLALKESWKSLSSDPGNASAHRFLSDAYAGVPRHEIAQVSELLQAQLLQPEITTPVSPSASEANLLAFEGSGPSVAGFNEYNPMFNRERLTFLASGVTGSNNTRGSEIVAGAFAKRGMLSAGHFRENSDGFRENNDSDQTITNVFGQFRITSDLSVQGEVKQREGEFGDLIQRFDSDNFIDSLRRNIDSDSYRLGLNYSPNPNQTFLISASSQDLQDSDSRTGSLIELDSDGKQYEVQYFHQWDDFNIIAGAGYLDSDQDTATSFTFFGFTMTEQESITVTQKMAHLYLNSPWPMGEYTIGIDYMDIDDETSLDKNKVNPKFGAIWNISDNTHFRVAAFKMLSSEIINNQTLSPTTIVGFNQYYDDFLGAESKRYAMGLDHSFTNDLDAGVEITRREIENDFDDPFLSDETHRELDHKLYAYLSITPSVGIISEYNYEKFERDFAEGLSEADRPALLITQSSILGATYTHSSGFYTKVTSSYVDQEIKNILPVGTSTESDQFWLTDLVLGYRLPKRMGKIEVSAKNLFDKDFNYQSTHPGTGTPQSSPYYPERSLLLSAQLWL